MSEIKNINVNEYKNATKSGCVIVDFWAPWCSNCRMLNPIVEQLSQSFSEKVNFIKVNIDENEELAKDNSVQTLPTLIFYKDGVEVDRSIGFKLKVALERWINGLL